MVDSNVLYFLEFGTDVWTEGVYWVEQEIDNKLENA